MAASAPFIGAIADDLTGATDLALTLSRGGMRVKQVVGVPDDVAVLTGADAIVVSLKSRTIAADAAVALSRAAGEKLLAAGARQLFFKYCSTFDSTDAGNIGPVTDTLLDLLGAAGTLACPAFPANRRTVYKGHLFVGDQLLSDSPMKDHPLTPMRDANLVRVLARQTRRAVSLIDIDPVRGDEGAFAAQLEATDGIAIVDALTDADLRAIGAAARGLKLVTGGSGVALGLPANFGFSPAASSATLKAPAGRATVLAGSCSIATRAQIDIALAAGYSGFRLDPLAIAEGQQTVDEAARFAHEADGIPVIYASAAPEEVARSQTALGTARAGTLIEDFLSSLAARLAGEGFSRLVVAGGESSGAVIAGLAISSLDIGPEIDPGVPWMAGRFGDIPIAIALKSGNFGADDMLIKAWDKLS